jgi:hypothetical protein
MPGALATWPQGLKMKLTSIKAAVAVCLLVPVMAMADSAKTFSYSFSDMASTDVKIGSHASGFLSFDVSWQDMLAGFSRSSQNPVQADSLTWTLEKGNTTYRSGYFTDTSTGPDSGTLFFDEAGLAKGTYKLKLSGLWSGTATGIKDNWHVTNEGNVTLSKNGTFSEVSPVPEPESYAMFLAGLGLMGTIALRRKKSEAS